MWAAVSYWYGCLLLSVKMVKENQMGRSAAPFAEAELEKISEYSELRKI